MAERTADIDKARDAVERGSWAKAYDIYRSLDPAGLTPDDLKGFAESAWWLAKTDEAIATRQRAYSGYADAGDDPQASRIAVWLTFDHFERGEPAVAMGWLMRAQRHLAEHDECVQHGYVAICQAVVGQQAGDLDGAMALVQRATRIGQRFGDKDLVALGIHGQGLVLIGRGQVAEGMSLLDEAMTWVVAGELSPELTGVIYCNVLDACLDLADLGRAGEWNEAARAWCETLPPEAPFNHRCRVNRAKVASLRGAWSEAEAEAELVSAAPAFDPEAAAKAFYEIGEIRRRTGNLVGAEESFARASEIGSEPQPGLALLRLAQGRTEAAVTGLRLAVAGEAGNRPRLARLLAAQVEVTLATGDIDGARSASDGLSAIARDLGTPALVATAAMARGALADAEGDIPAALEGLRQASAIWQELRLPYEAARARMLFGVAVRKAGDLDGAKLELAAAFAAFERLGAAPDAAEAAELLADREDLPRGLSHREAEVLRLVAAGKSNRDVAEALVISQHTVARHLQNIYGKIGVSSRSGATAFAFEHGLV